MIRPRFAAALVPAVVSLLVSGPTAAQMTAPPKPARAAAKLHARAPQLEPKAMDLLRACRSLWILRPRTWASDASCGRSASLD